MDISNFLIDPKDSIRKGLEKIEKNHYGIVFVSKNLCISGVATDGDIRRHLLNGGSLDENMSKVSNENFSYGEINESRESLLKKFDNGVRVIPLVEMPDKKITSIINKDYFPIQIERPTFTRARAPVRVSFSGGGSDVTNYFNIASGAVINSTISLFSHATLRVRSDNSIHVYSKDLKSSIKADSLREFTEIKDEKFGLIQAILKLINPEFGFDLNLYSDFPTKSGLGGSSAVSASILGCFNEMRKDKWDLYELSDLAYQAERLNLGVSGGWQDQYATVFGGINFIEFNMDQNIVHPLRIPDDARLELEESLVLCWVGGSHDGGDIHDDQRKMTETEKIRDLVEANVEISREMRDELLRGRLGKLGTLMNKAWIIKRQLSSKISSPYLDSIYTAAIENGALGGKLLGAGGGGFFIFFVSPFSKMKLIDALEDLSLKIQPFRFEAHGMKSWTVREN